MTIRLHIHKKIFLITISLFLCASSLFLSVCNGSKQEVAPRMVYPGYSTELIFHESFNENLHYWHIEGDGEAQITEDGQLLVGETPESGGIAIWIVQDIPDNFQLEYEVEIPETPGMNTIILCAQGTQGENILTKLPPRSGNLNEYIRGNICSYHISYHCYDSEGRNSPGSKIRKNPGHMLLSRVEPDPCLDNRRYFIDVVKLGNRIQFFVDGEKIHDIRDKGGFHSAYMEGKIGFWIHGSGGVFTTSFDNVQVFKLNPL